MSRLSRPSNHSKSELLKIKLVYIFLVKNERLTESNFIANDLNIVQPSGPDFIVARFERVVAKRVGGINGEVSKIKRVPQHNAVDDAFFDIRLTHIRQ